MTKKEASALGRMKRRKGSSYERDVAEAMRVLWPDARRGIGQTRSAGEVSDVEGTPWWIEAKHHKQAPNVHAAYAQGEEAKKLRHPGRRVLVVSRKTGDGLDLVTLKLEDFLLIMEEVLAGG